MLKAVWSRSWPPAVRQTKLYEEAAATVFLWLDVFFEDPCGWVARTSMHVQNHLGTWEMDMRMDVPLPR